MKLVTLACLTLVLCALNGCAAVNGLKPDPRDPFERTNRATFRVNDSLDRYVARPAASAYRKVVPKFAQTGVSNFMSNIGYPTVFINDFLQAKFRDGFSDVGRFLMNSTFGLGGLFDPASDAGLELHDEDFGQTLGKWGVPPGPYLMLPLIGPSSARDSFGLLLDQASDPRQYIGSTRAKIGLQLVHQLDKRSHLLDADAVLDRAADKYTIVRSAYLQRRLYRVKDGNVPDESPSDLEDPDPGADSQPAGSEPAPAVRLPAPAAAAESTPPR